MLSWASQFPDLAFKGLQDLGLSGLVGKKPLSRIVDRRNDFFLGKNFLPDHRRQQCVQFGPGKNLFSGDHREQGLYCVFK